MIILITPSLLASCQERLPRCIKSYLNDDDFIIKEVPQTPDYDQQPKANVFLDGPSSIKGYKWETGRLVFSPIPVSVL